MKEPVLPPLPHLQCAALKHLAGPFPQNECFTRAEAEDFARAYALEAVKAERERLLELAKSKGWGMKNDDPFEDWLTDLIGELDRAAIRSQEG